MTYAHFCLLFLARAGVIYPFTVFPFAASRSYLPSLV
jgi:hypothetical protein